MRTFWCRFIAIVIIILLSSGLSCAENLQKGIFIYLNSPESVVSPGILADYHLQNDQLTRVFFHYRNETKHGQYFDISISSPVRQGKMSCYVDLNPGIAGQESAKCFLGAQPTVLILRKHIWLDRDMCVSGILEGIPTQPCRLHCSMGSGDIILKARILTADFVEYQVDAKIGDTIQIGTRQTGIDGDYGITLRYSIINATYLPVTLRVFVDPRGGEAPVVYSISGKAYTSMVYPPLHQYFLTSTIINPRKTFIIEFMPVGGYNYPLTVRFVQCDNTDKDTT